MYNVGLAKDYSLAIVLGFLNPLVVPENKRKFIVFSFRPIDITNLLFLYFILTHILCMLVQWTTDMHLFHIWQKWFLGKDTL